MRVVEALRDMIDTRNAVPKMCHAQHKFFSPLELLKDSESNEI
jgi:hypothetical protein